MRSLIMCLIAAVALGACDTTRSLSGADRDAFEQHEAQWEARTFHDYTFDYSEQSLGRTSRVHITVEDDTVADVIDVDTGDPPDIPNTWPTIDDLFSEADFFIRQDEFSLDLEYNDEIGYITLLSAHGNGPGGGVLARVSNFQPTP